MYYRDLSYSYICETGSLCSCGILSIWRQSPHSVAGHCVVTDVHPLLPIINAQFSRNNFPCFKYLPFSLFFPLSTTFSQFSCNVAMTFLSFFLSFWINKSRRRVISMRLAASSFPLIISRKGVTLAAQWLYDAFYSIFLLDPQSYLSSLYFEHPQVSVIPQFHNNVRLCFTMTWIKGRIN